MPRSPAIADSIREDAAHPSVETAKRVLGMEAAGLALLAETLDGQLGETFQATVSALKDLKGRVIATGMGKSGHVARKIAATMASVGTPAYFVHPGEASHGDLGMVTRDDAVLALSNSGETKELSDIVAYCVRFEIPLIGMTCRAGSALAKAATFPFVLPQSEEACPLGLAPTTSTTMMLAMGDALSVALLEANGFTAEDFHLFHPGGKLGRTLLKVADLMHGGQEVPLVARDTPMTDALITVTAKHFGCVGIVDDDGRLAGIITDGDLRRHMDASLFSKTAADIMTPAPKRVRPDALAAEALRLMNTNSITSLFVVEDDKPVGILHIHDCLRAGVA